MQKFYVNLKVARMKSALLPLSPAHKEATAANLLHWPGVKSVSGSGPKDNEHLYVAGGTHSHLLSV